MEMLAILSHGKDEEKDRKGERRKTVEEQIE
jgi:hypothetical protein